MKALFIGDWESLAMVHFEIPPLKLQPAIPFELDLLNGSALISLVFFTMRGMRLACGPRALKWLFYPFREQRFLNVRTYMRHRGEPGIHFITEWISDPVCARLGSLLYSLPYRRGRHRFSLPYRRGRHRFSLSVNTFRAHVTDSASKTSLACEIRFAEPFARCEPGSRDEFLFERYAAFNNHGRRDKSFHVSHAPWKQCRASATIVEDSLLRTFFLWYADTRIVGANYSPGVRNVRMGRPEKI